MAEAAAIVRLAAMGDVMLARDVERHFVEAPDDFRMDDIRGVLGGFDLVCLNLENPIGTHGQPDAVQDPHVTFRSSPATLQVLKTLGTSLVSLGNNHALDYGDGALADTLDLLDEAGIGRVGAGRNYEEANRPLLLTCKGRRLAFLSYAFIYSANTRMAGRRSGGVSDHRLTRVLPRIRELRRAGHEVVVFIHWGHEYSFYPLPYQMRQARRMIDAGASIILGHGPHYPQGFEEYRDGRIVYSLGNFIFDEPHRYANRSFIYGVDLARPGAAGPGTVFPVHLYRHVPRLVDGADKREMERVLDGLSAAYARRDAAFWHRISDAYMTDIVGRVLRTRSLKYLRVPPLSFYRDVGPSGLARRLGRLRGQVVTRVARPSVSLW